MFPAQHDGGRPSERRRSVAGLYAVARAQSPAAADAVARRVRLSVLLLVVLAGVALAAAVTTSRKDQSRVPPGLPDNATVGGFR